MKFVDKDKIELAGEVIESLPNTIFKVELPNKQIVLAYLAGKMRLHYIKIIPGDKVLIEMTPYNLTKGRIIRRL